MVNSADRLNQVSPTLLKMGKLGRYLSKLVTDVQYLQFRTALLIRFLWYTVRHNNLV